MEEFPTTDSGWNEWFPSACVRENAVLADLGVLAEAERVVAETVAEDARAEYVVAGQLLVRALNALAAAREGHLDDDAVVAFRAAVQARSRFLNTAEHLIEDTAAYQLVRLRGQRAVLAQVARIGAIIEAADSRIR